MPIIVYQLIPIAVVLLPLFIAITFALWWRHTIASPWLYGVVGTVVAYAVAVGVVWISERYERSVRGHVGGGYVVMRQDALPPGPVQSAKPAARHAGPMFEPLSLSWFGLLTAIIILCALALWGLKLLFRGGAA